MVSASRRNVHTVYCDVRHMQELCVVYHSMVQECTMLAAANRYMSGIVA